VLACTTAAIKGQGGTGAGEWRTYGGDLGSTRYVPHDQINAGNFSKLQVAWRFKTDVFGIRPDYNLQTTPLMINGVLYATAGARRDAWRSMPRQVSCCGCTDWTKASGRLRRRGCSRAATSRTGRMVAATNASSW
jgi:hypothetical protein